MKTIRTCGIDMQKSGAQHLSLTMRADPRTVRRCNRRVKQLLEQILHLPLEVRKRFLDLGDFSGELVRFELKHLSAPRAGNCRVSLRLTDRYFQFLVAVRARNIERLIV